MLFLLPVLCILLLLSGALNAWLFLRQPDPKILGLDSQNRVTEIVPLDKPLVTQAKLLSWTAEAVVEIWKLDFVNYRSELNDKARYFLPAGHAEYLKALDSSGTLKLLTTANAVVTAIPTESPVIARTMRISGRLAWEIQIPITVTYRTQGNRKEDVKMIVTATVARRTTAEEPVGIGILRFVAKRA